MATNLIPSLVSVCHLVPRQLQLSATHVAPTGSLRCRNLLPRAVAPGFASWLQSGREKMMLGVAEGNHAAQPEPWLPAAPHLTRYPVPQDRYPVQDVGTVLLGPACGQTALRMDLSLHLLMRGHNISGPINSSTIGQQFNHTNLTSN